MSSGVPIFSLVEDFASLRSMRILCFLFLILGNLGLALTFQELSKEYIVIFAVLINGGFIALWKYYNWWFGVEELWLMLIIMDEKVELILVFLGFILFLNICYINVAGKLRKLIMTPLTPIGPWPVISSPHSYCPFRGWSMEPQEAKELIGAKGVIGSSAG